MIDRLRDRFIVAPLRALRNALIAPRLKWYEPEPGALYAGEFMILDATTPMEGVYCYQQTGKTRRDGSPDYRWIATTHSLASAQRACEWRAHRAKRSAT